jgi:hypothetical protein
LKRVQETPQIRFFDPRENKLMEVLAAHLLPQDDREPSRRIPIVPRIDERLHNGLTPGYRFSTMPADGDAYRLGFQAIDKIANQSYGRTFLELPWSEQEEFLKSIHDAKPNSGAGSILPTQGSANPGLTIQALAARTADYLISQGTRIFNSDRRDGTPPPVRAELSPPGTHGAGVPRLS